MDLLGPSLYDLLSKTNKNMFSLKTVLMLIDQMITIVSYIHSKKFILRNISPNNFCIGLDRNAHKLYIVSLGSAKRYIQKNG